MRTISITKVIELRWEITGMQGYYFGADKKLYNGKTGREIRKTLNGRSKGYWIGKKFYSLNKLRPLIIKIEKDYCPF